MNRGGLGSEYFGGRIPQRRERRRVTKGLAVFIVRSAIRLIYKFVREGGAVHPASARLQVYKSVQSARFRSVLAFFRVANRRSSVGLPGDVKHIWSNNVFAAMVFAVDSDGKRLCCMLVATDEAAPASGAD